MIEAAGSTGAVLTALAAARRGGAVLLLGLPPHGDTAAVPVDDLVNNDLTIRASFGYTSAAWRDVVTLLNAGRAGPGLPGHPPVPAGGLRGGAAHPARRPGRPAPGAPRGKVLLTLGH